ncbi:UDP-2,3-diacylglucosamine diphosphatase [Alteromonas sp. a30]|uniref:UDP-2,3-diacylglucosamine diphosphatase n=1 Tax=Alteromonas sp. a30 TaxID=2730917 RepID=UPI00227EAE14|nr:UDP-2,3-diacylglucosamine diphosphatase [Alteromonas sp. a30]MCY7296596.1 UDP-2,3-diacylglucosamine diphosphatase [Alteromonas sp. a30]
MAFTYFIADLHLSADRPDITQCLVKFLVNDAPQADALYVLGDLFEAWIGDDDINPFTTHVADAFKQFSETGKPIYFIHGNRDFLIREAFAKRAGFTLLPERTVIDLYGTPTLIMHGDELCTRDVEYQKFRKKARGWWWPRLMLLFPLWKRREIAQKGREKSQSNTSNLQQAIMDVTPEEVVKAMQEANVTRLIHGHTHRPAIHDISVHLAGKSEKAQRIVLGDWYTQGSVLKVSASHIELESRQFQHLE